jgi:hypothetical protein
VSFKFLYRNTDAAPLAAFRILMGLLMAAEGFGAIITGWVGNNFVNVPFTFNFIGFEFLQIINGQQAYAIYAVLGLAGIGIALGYRYRLMVLIYLILWCGVYLAQKTSYNNHYYLLLLFCMLFLIAPMNVYRSLDVKQGRLGQSQTVPYWSVWMFKALLAIVYFYAALAKLYPDWLSGKAVGTFLLGKCEYPVIGPYCRSEWLIMIISYGGIFFDFLVIPALWYKPTRIYAFGVSIFFHLFNSLVFQIGIFPYMMLITTILYFEPAAMRRLFFRNTISEPYSGFTYPQPFRKKWLETGFIIFFALMILLPLRHFLYPGSPHWSEEAHRLSWHMMLRSKHGYLQYKVVNPSTGETEIIEPSERLPEKMARTMATRPDQIWQYAQRLKAEYIEKGIYNPKVYAISNVSLNHRPYRPLIDPEANLAVAEWYHIKSNNWILQNPDLW